MSQRRATGSALAIMHACRILLLVPIGPTAASPPGSSSAHNSPDLNGLDRPTLGRDGIRQRCVVSPVKATPLRGASARYQSNVQATGAGAGAGRSLSRSRAERSRSRAEPEAGRPERSRSRSPSPSRSRKPEPEPGQDRAVAIGPQVRTGLQRTRSQMIWHRSAHCNGRTAPSDRY